MAHVKKSKDNLQKRVLSYHYVGPQNGTSGHQAPKESALPGWKLAALTNPSSVFGMKTSLKDLTSLRTTSVSLFPFLLIRKGLTL